MHVEDRFAALDIRAIDDDLTIEATGAQQRRVEHVGTVGSTDQDDALVAVEAIHLDQDRVERLLAFVVTTAHAGAALATHSIDLIEEHDARTGFARLLEQVAHAAGANSNEHLDEVATADREER